MPLLAADPVTVLPDSAKRWSIWSEPIRPRSNSPCAPASSCRRPMAWACVRAHASSASGPRRYGIGASAGGRRRTGSRSPSGWPMRRARERRRRSRPSRSALWWR